MVLFRLKENAEFVCAMGDVLDVYTNARMMTLIRWFVMDESSKQNTLRRHVNRYRQNQAPSKSMTAEYERNGVSKYVHVFFEPLEGKRHVVVTDQRTALDWAHQIRNLVDVEYPRAERINTGYG